MYPEADSTVPLAVTVTYPLIPIHTNKYCAGYTQHILDTKKTVEDCLNWVKNADPTAGYFFWRPDGNYHCSPCPPAYGGTTAGLSGSDTETCDVYDMQTDKKYVRIGAETAKFAMPEFTLDPKYACPLLTERKLSSTP